MAIDERLLKREESAVYALRSLYRRFGYTQFKMSKFEEYDLYVRNKDFLVSDGIITFTDTNGRLKALKPDVTLSIINNSKDTDGVQKLYYNENVYRISGSTHTYKEIMQTGLECVGNIGLFEVCEVLNLAIKSLETIDNNTLLELSHVGLIEAAFDELKLSKELEKKVINQAKFTDEEKYGASSIGKIVIKATACCNKLTSANDGYDPKELVNLILGRTEVAKAEILRIVNSDLEAERKSELIDDCKKSAEDYFESVMAQKE